MIHLQCYGSIRQSKGPIHHIRWSELVFCNDCSTMLEKCIIVSSGGVKYPVEKIVKLADWKKSSEKLVKMASNDLVVQNYDIAHLCQKALERENMKAAIISSYRQVYLQYGWYLLTS